MGSRVGMEGMAGIRTESAVSIEGMVGIRMGSRVGMESVVGNQDRVWGRYGGCHGESGC